MTPEKNKNPPKELLNVQEKDQIHDVINHQNRLAFEIAKTLRASAPNKCNYLINQEITLDTINSKDQIRVKTFTILGYEV